MSSEANTNLVLRYWQEVWNNRNLEMIEELFAPDQVSGQHFFVSRTHQAFTDGIVTVQDIFASGDKVVTRYEWSAVHTGVWELELGDIPMSVPPTGNRVWDRGISIFQVRDGKLIAGWSEWTKLELAQQLAAIQGTLKADR